MITSKSITIKKLEKICSQKIEQLIPIVRDSNYANYMGIKYDLQAFFEDKDLLAVKYSTRDDYEKKNIISSFSNNQELTLALQSSINLEESFLLCPPINIIINSQKNHFDGGIFKMQFLKRSVDYEKKLKYFHCNSLYPYIETIREASLPTLDVGKYVSWLEKNTDVYISLERNTIYAIICLLKGSVKIVSFYWDKDGHYDNIASLLKYFSGENLNKTLYVMSPIEKEPSLKQFGFQKVAEWRLLYGAI